MATLVTANGVAPDSWVRAETLAADAPQPSHLLFKWADFIADPSASLARAAHVGVVVPGGTPWTLIAPHAARLEVVAIEFPSVGDGRGYSLARQLREQGKYTGELRAVGQIFRDHIPFLARCGFTVFESATKEPPEALLAALKTFTVAYQPATAEPTITRFRRF